MDENARQLLAADRSHWWFRSKAVLVSTALRHTATGPGGLLVDVGAGAGGVTAMLGWDERRVIAVEGGRVLVDHAHRANGLLAVQGLVEHLPLATCSADVICLLDVIEHLADPSAALQEAARVLRPGGRLVVNVPGHQWLWSPADEQLGHHRRYNRRTLRTALESEGFSICLLTHVFSWLAPIVWWERRRPTGTSPALGLDRTSPAIDRAATVLTLVERLLVGRVTLPIGSSVLCVANAPAPRSGRVG